MNKEYKENMNPKECSICHKVKPQGEFYKAGGIHQSACKECKKTRYKENVENIKKMQQEIERLNNIINELEKWLNDLTILKTDKFGEVRFYDMVKIQAILDKLNELKGDSSNE